MKVFYRFLLAIAIILIINVVIILNHNDVKSANLPNLPKPMYGSFYFVQEIQSKGGSMYIYNNSEGSILVITSQGNVAIK